MNCYKKITESSGNKVKSGILDIVLIALFTALIAICSQISIPIGPVPFTLQTLGIFITAALLGLKRGTISILVYILVGLVGVPVFAGFSGGIGSVASPAFGYVIGFILTAIVVGLSKKFFENKIIPLVISMIIGLILCYAAGTIWFIAIYGITGLSVDLGSVLGWCVWPFIIPDVCKIVIAAILVNRLDKIIKL